MKQLKKIVIIGGESTGKSTLCEQLAFHYHTSWVREYAREYLEPLQRPYQLEDLLKIAKGQIRSEKEQKKHAQKFLFCDTDLYVIKVWSEYKFGSCDKYILREIELQHNDAYIITAPDFPWQDDPLREHPEPKLRQYFFNTYLKIIKNTGLPFVIVKSNEKTRFRNAVQFIQQEFSDM